MWWQAERATGFQIYTGGCTSFLNKLKNNSACGDLELKILFGREIHGAAAALISDLQTKFILQRGYSVYKTALQSGPVCSQRLELSEGQSWRYRSSILRYLLQRKHHNSNNYLNEINFFEVYFSSLSHLHLAFMRYSCCIGETLYTCVGTLRNFLVYIKNYSVLVHNKTTEFAVRFSLKIIMISAFNKTLPMPIFAKIPLIWAVYCKWHLQPSLQKVMEI
jgi:hypothetical protein